MTNYIINAKILKNINNKIDECGFVSQTFRFCEALVFSSRRERMKKLIAFILTLALATTLFATLTSCDGNSKKDTTVKYTWDITEADGEVTLNGYTVSDGAKDLIADKKYKELAEGFTANNTDGKTYDENTVKTVTIPEKVTKISANAIDSLSFIEELVVGENVKEIELGAFSNLSSLKKITLPFVGSMKGAADVTNDMIGAANAKKLFGYIFGTASTSSLTSCTQTYNDGASGNTATYYIPTTLETVVVTGTIAAAEKTIKVNKNEDGEYVLPAEGEEGKYEITVKTYADCAVQPYAFYGITTIKTVYLKGNDVFANTFNGCTALKNVYIEGEKVTVGKSAFNGCTALKNVTTEEKVGFKGIAVIGESAFSGCTTLGVSSEFALGQFNLTDCEKIGKSAFSGCTSLVTVNFSASIPLDDGVSVEEKAFNGCTGIIAVKKGDTVVVSKDVQMIKGSPLAKIFSGCSDTLYKEDEKI